ncbi:unnamed protein product [Caenorhabditis angaria]|uniref:B30.2/SPRY domain-containing protein n=1 Tax=Caenorhabditis angaria TaxID=860376 RepID=A0A9P1IAJ6_9PELO|nr:unnamed protein product [Caenorhabditis angaria]
MRSSKTSRRAAPKTAPTSVCYCNGNRELGTIEIVCSQCLKWFHSRCLKELSELNGIPFMICYTFTCKECRPASEDWKVKKADLVHMCVTVFANLSAEKLKENDKLSVDTIPSDYTYLSIKDNVIPYMDSNWDMLTAVKKKPTWHQNLVPTLIKEKNIFIQSGSNPDLFALAEKNLSLLGPLHESVKMIGRKVVAASAKEEKPPIELPPIEGPKTRGASKRRNAENPPSGKKPKMASDFCSMAISGTHVDVPFSKDNYRYLFSEKDPHVEADEAPATISKDGSTIISSLGQRIVSIPTVAISSHDRAYQLLYEQSSPTTWTITGHEGYAMARCTHSVSVGTWYFEVTFDEQPNDSHIRIGWSQPFAALQACVGYNKFSYGWRSKHGTKFHDGRGQTYQKPGFKEGDILGCLIHLPSDPSLPSEVYLPPSHKDDYLINFKGHYFFEVNDVPTEEAKKLRVLEGSRIEFFLNGKSCGTAYENIYAGHYFPAVSLFHRAKVTVNFGPKFKNLPKLANGMHLRADQQHHEQTLSDILHIVSK